MVFKHSRQTETAEFPNMIHMPRQHSMYGYGGFNLLYGKTKE